AVLGGALATIAMILALVFEQPIVHTLFHGQGLLLVALLAAIICYFAAFISRGALSGNGRFGPYGLMHGSEGTVRILACVVLFAVGTHSVGPWAFALVTPPLIAVAVSLSRQRGLMTPGPEAPYSELSGALAWLVVGSVLAQLLSYASVFGVNRLAHTQHEKDLAAAFIT